MLKCSFGAYGFLGGEREKEPVEQENNLPPKNP